MTTIELNNRICTLISEIMNIESEDILEKLKKLIDKETQHKKKPLAYSVEELKQEELPTNQNAPVYQYNQSFLQ